MRKEKPYYLRQPWDVLFKEKKLENVSPWNINLVLLLSTLLEEMEKSGIDFRIAGTAIHSSVLIFLKKADMLLKMEELPQPEKEDGVNVYIPPALPLPFRFEYTTTTVNDLIEALEKTLLERSGSNQPKLPILPAPIPDFLEAEQYLLEIESRADELLEELKWRYEKGGIVQLSQLVYYLDWIETVRVFMMLLFLGQKLEIDFTQDEKQKDILIRVLEEQ
jgi:chromatin segregation and condensation protein Rec8/ScpA/Scc1 (kleisin family)